MIAHYDPVINRSEWRVSPLERTAHSLRQAILTRLDRYYHCRYQYIDSNHNAPRPTDSQPALDALSPVNANKLQLLRDIHQLSSVVCKLEKKQDDKGLMRWVICPVLALLCHFIYLELYKLPQFRAWTPWREINERGQHRPAYLTMFGLVPWFAIPASIYRIFSLEQRRNKTARLQESLSDLASDVQNNVPDPYIGWLKPSKWKRIDWDE